MAEINISCKKREISTKGVVNQMRRDEIVPGTLYSKGTDPISVAIPEILLKPIVYTSETNIINLSIDEAKPIKCILKDIQFDPVSDRIIHFDFYVVTVGQSLQLQVPVQIIGNPVGVKEGGQLQVQLHKLDIECLPKHIPDHIEIDVTNLDVGDSVHAGSLNIENVKILNPEDVLIVTVATPKGGQEEEEEEADALEDKDETAEPEVITKGKSEEEG